MSTVTYNIIAPFLPADVVTTPGYKVQKIVAGVLVDDVAHTTSVIAAIPNITNGYCAQPAVTLAADGSFEGFHIWDTGGGSPVVMQPIRLSIPASS